MSLRLVRFTIGRALIHAGLRAMPPGRVRDELYNVLAGWGHRVRAALAD